MQMNNFAYCVHEKFYKNSNKFINFSIHWLVEVQFNLNHCVI